MLLLLWRFCVYKFTTGLKYHFRVLTVQKYDCVDSILPILFYIFSLNSLTYVILPKLKQLIGRFSGINIRKFLNKIYWKSSK